MTDPKVVRALDLLFDRAFQNESSPQRTRVRDLIDALHVEREAALRAPLPALPDGVRPLVFDARFSWSRSADGTPDIVSRDGRDAYAQDQSAVVAVPTASRAESEATARVMHAAAEWHRAGYDLVPVRRTP